MNIRTFQITLLALWLGPLQACQSDEGFTPTYEVPTEFQVYIDTFLREAAARGHDLEINNLIIEIDDELTISMCGVCNSLESSDKAQKIIRLNPNCLDFNPTLVETLIFHELGHCILLRSHEESLLPNGDPRTMMVANNLEVYAPCIYAIDGGDDCNNTFKRDYYLDELFDESIPTPEWAD